MEKPPFSEKIRKYYLSKVGNHLKYQNKSRDETHEALSRIPKHGRSRNIVEKNLYNAAKVATICGQEWKRVKRERREEKEERRRIGGIGTAERTVYLATGGTYRSICAQPLSTQTAYVGT